MPASESEVLVGRRYLERGFVDAAMRLFIRNSSLVTAADWTRLADRLLERIDHAGAIFLGPYSPVALGDYVAGPSHVLPTGGTARFASGLSANDFLHRSSVLSFTREGLAQLAGDVRVLAECEGLTAHAASVDLRLSRSSSGMRCQP